MTRGIRQFGGDVKLPNSTNMSNAVLLLTTETSPAAVSGIPNEACVPPNSLASISIPNDNIPNEFAQKEDTVNVRICVATSHTKNKKTMVVVDEGGRENMAASKITS